MKGHSEALSYWEGPCQGGLGAGCPCEAQSNWFSHQRKGHFVFEILGKLREEEERARLRPPELPPCSLTKPGHHMEPSHSFKDVRRYRY